MRAGSWRHELQHCWRRYRGSSGQSPRPAASPARGDRGRRTAPHGRHRHSRAQRGARPARERAPPARVSDTTVSLLRPHHHRGQREHRLDAGGRRRARRGTARGPRAAAQGKRSRPSACGGVAYQRRARGQLYGRRSLHRPVGTASAGRACDLRPQPGLNRKPARHRLARDARTEARGDLARVQHSPPARAAGPLQGCAVRVQGAARRCGAEPAARRREPQLVLRHRAAGPRRACRPAHPRAAGRLAG